MILVMKMHSRFICFARDDIKSYRVGTTSEPPFLTENNIDFERDWLDERLDFDLVWYMAANHSNEDEIEMPAFGSWTVFILLVTDKRTIQSDLFSKII